MGPWLSEGCLKVAEKSYGQGYVLPGCKALLHGATRMIEGFSWFEWDKGQALASELRFLGIPPL